MNLLSELLEILAVAPWRLSGVRKSRAILLLTLPQEAGGGGAQAVCTPEAVEEVSREIAVHGRYPAGHCGERSSANFITWPWPTATPPTGGLEYAKQLLQKSLSEAEAARVIKQVTQQVQTTPFSFLQKAESENLLTFIQDEHPQTIALILAHLPPQKASEILVGLPSQKQIEVVKRVANMEQTNPEVIKEVERGLEHRLSDIVSQTFEKAGGVDSVAEILNLADRSTEKGIMEGLEAEDPDLVEQIRRLMFVFEDILLVNDKGIQSVLKEVDNEELALALKTASQELKDKIFKNMSERAAQLIAEDMQYMGPVRVSDVESAQQKIVDVVRRDWKTAAKSSSRARRRKGNGRVKCAFRVRPRIRSGSHRQNGFDQASSLTRRRLNSAVPQCPFPRDGVLIKSQNAPPDRSSRFSIDATWKLQAQAAVAARLSGAGGTPMVMAAEGGRRDPKAAYARRA